MRLTKDDHVIQTLSSDRSDQSFDVPVLPRRPGCRRSISDSHRSEASPEHLSVVRKYIDDPQEYARVFYQAEFEALDGEEEPAMDGSDDASLYYRKVLFLDSVGIRGAQSAAEKAAKTKRPGSDAEAALDTKLYRVILEAVDTTMTSPESFTLKLAMAVSAPLPTIRTRVKNAPCALRERINRTQADRLMKLVKKHGGIARMEAHENKTTVPPPEKKRPPTDSPKTECMTTSGFHARATVQDVQCPKCGWSGNASAEYCEICLHDFANTRQVDMDTRMFANEPDPATTAAVALEYMEAPTRWIPNVWLLVAGGLIIAAIVTAIAL